MPSWDGDGGDAGWRWGEAASGACCLLPAVYMLTVCCMVLICRLSSLCSVLDLCSFKVRGEPPRRPLLCTSTGCPGLEPLPRPPHHPDFPHHRAAP
jgi:hypothetical protein